MAAYKDAYWGGTEGFEVAAANAKKSVAGFKDLADSLQGSIQLLEAFGKDSQKTARDHMAKDGGVNTPLFEAVFVSRDRQAAAAQMCLEHVRKIEDRARAEAARKQLDNFLKGAQAPQLANTVRLAQRKLQQSEKKTKPAEKAERMDKLKADVQKYETALATEIETLENMERGSGASMRKLLAEYAKSVIQYHEDCLQALKTLEQSVEELDEDTLLAKLAASSTTGSARPLELLESGNLSSAVTRKSSSASGTVGKAIGTLRKKGDLLRRKTGDSMHNSSQTSVHSHGSQRSLGSGRGSVRSQNSAVSGASSSMAAAAGAAAGASTLTPTPSWAAQDSAAPQSEDRDKEPAAGSDSEDEDDAKKKLKVNIRSQADTTGAETADASAYRLNMDPAVVQRRPGSPTDRRRQRPISQASQSSDNADDFNPRSPQAWRAVPTISSPLSLSSQSRLGSFQTFRPSGPQAVYGMQVAIMETINAYFKGPSLGKVLVTGKVVFSFDRAIVEDLMLENKPFAFKLTRAQGVGAVTPNPAVLGSGAPSSADANGDLYFSVEPAALQRCLAAAENNEAVPGLSYVGQQLRVTVVGYTVTSAQPMSLVPLRLCSTWRCTEDKADLSVDYLYNNKATSAALSDVVLTTDMQGLGITGCQIAGLGLWAEDKAMWKLPLISGQSGRGRVQASFSLAQALTRPPRVLAKFVSQGATISGIDIVSDPGRGSSLGFSRCVRRYMTGQYISDYAMAPAGAQPMSPVVAHAQSTTPLSGGSMERMMDSPPQPALESTPAPAESAAAAPVEAVETGSVETAAESVAEDTSSRPTHARTASSNPEYDSNMDIGLQADEMHLEAEHVDASASTTMPAGDDSDEDDEDDDKGKGLAEETDMVQVIVQEEINTLADPSSTVSQASSGLPNYDVVTSTPTVPLDFEAFLAMTRPRTPKSSPRAQR